MKVLFIQKVKGYSGSEKFILETIPGLEARGLTVHFLAVYQQPEDLDNLSYRFEKKGIHTIYLQAKNDLNLKLLKDIHQIVKEGEYDLVHSHLIHADVWMALVKVFFNRKIKLVSTKHNYDEAYTNQYGFDPSHLKWWDRYFFLSYWAEKKVNYSITISQGLYHLYDKGNITPAHRLRYIPYGFDLPEFEPPEDSACRLAPQQLIIVGRLVGFKGHRFAIQALPGLLKKFPELKLVIVGEGEERESLQGLVGNLQLGDAVEFVGYQTNVFEWMNQSDVVLLPSVSEGFGIVILEAFNSRTPLVAFDVPAPNEIVEPGKTGLLAKPYELDDLAEKIEFFLKKPEEGQKMASSAYEKLMSFYCMDRMAREILEVYEGLL